MDGEDILMLRQKELKRLHVIRRVLEGVIKQVEASKILSLSYRQIRRIVGRVRGERAGGAPTEEVALALKVLYGLDLGLHLEKLYALSRLLCEMSRVQVPPNKAVVGENAFAQEAGLVVSGWKEEPLTAEPYLPEVVGQRPKLILGKKSGKQTIEFKLKGLGRKASEEQLDALLLRVKLQAERAKAPVSDDDFQKMVDAVLGN